MPVFIKHSAEARGGAYGSKGGQIQVHAKRGVGEFGDARGGVFKGRGIRHDGRGSHEPGLHEGKNLMVDWFGCTEIVSVHDQEHISSAPNRGEHARPTIMCGQPYYNA